jgi:hypothetical protein
MAIGPGRHRARALPGSVDFGYSSAGNEQIAVTFQLVDEPHAGQTITWFSSFASDKATAITLRALRTCGWLGDNLADLEGIDASEVDLVCEEEEYEGERRLRVRWVNPPGGARLAQPMSEGERRAFAERMRGTVLAMDAKEGKAAASPLASRPRASRGAQQPAAAGSSGVDDIPF